MDQWTQANFMDATSTDVDVHVLGEVQLLAQERQVLSLGIRFIPAPPLLPPEVATAKLVSSLNAYERRLLLGFQNGLDKQPVRGLQFRSKKSPNLDLEGNRPMESFINVLKTRLLGAASQQSFQAKERFQSNHRLDNTIRRLRRRCASEIIVCTTDKNLGLAVMTQTFYRSHIFEHLKPPKFELVERDIKELKDSLAKSYNDVIDPDRRLSKSKDWPVSELLKFLQSLIKDFTFQKFSGIPKVHKPTLAFRPIQSFRGWLAQPLASYLSAVLQPFLRKTFKAICSDSSSLVKNLEVLKKDLPTEIKLFTADVVNLYPSIPQDSLLSTLERQILEIHRTYELTENSQLPYSPSELFELFKYVITVNYCSFDGLVYRQISGIPTGSNCSVELANLWLCTMERPLVTNPKLLFYTRYIDDILGITTTDFDLGQFSSAYNQLHGNLKLEFSQLQDKVEFLDIVISADETTKLRFQVHQKALNKYLYIPKFSFHKEHLFSGFIHGELLRYLLRCSLEEDFLDICDKFYLRLLKRGYSESFIERCMAKVSFKDRQLLVDQPGRAAGNPRPFPPPTLILPFDRNFEHFQPKAVILGAFEEFKERHEWREKDYARILDCVNETKIAWTSSKALTQLLSSRL